LGPNLPSKLISSVTVASARHTASAQVIGPSNA
jgi:hypothetical protein